MPWFNPEWVEGYDYPDFTDSFCLVACHGSGYSKPLCSHDESKRRVYACAQCNVEWKSIGLLLCGAGPSLLLMSTVIVSLSENPETRMLVNDLVEYLIIAVIAFFAGVYVALLQKRQRSIR